MLQFEEEGDSKPTPHKSARASAKKKDGEEEFFNMTYLSNLLPHPQSKKLIEIQTQKGFKFQDELFKQVEELNKPFFEWNDWIKEQLDNTLKEFQEKKSKRLLDIGKF